MPKVTDLNHVPYAHVHVMKFKFRGISIDFLYASVATCIVPDLSEIYN